MAVTAGRVEMLFYASAGEFQKCTVQFREIGVCNMDIGVSAISLL